MKETEDLESGSLAGRIIARDFMRLNAMHIELLKLRSSFYIVGPERFAYILVRDVELKHSPVAPQPAIHSARRTERCSSSSSMGEPVSCSEIAASRKSSTRLLSSRNQSEL